MADQPEPVTLTITEEMIRNAMAAVRDHEVIFNIKASYQYAGIDYSSVEHLGKRAPDLIRRLLTALIPASTGVQIRFSEEQGGSAPPQQ